MRQSEVCSIRLATLLKLKKFDFRRCPNELYAELRPAEGSEVKTGDAAEVVQQAMAKQPAEAIKVPVSVPVQAANAALKAGSASVQKTS